MWAVARYDFSLSESEFGKLTLSQFWLLYERRTVEWKRQCYLFGVPASATYNVNRIDAKSHCFTPWDFVPIVKDAKKEQQEEILTMLQESYSKARLMLAKQNQYNPELGILLQDHRNKFIENAKKNVKSMGHDMDDLIEKHIG